MINSSRYPILVSGGSGHLGQLVLQELLSARKVPGRCIIATTRTPEKLAMFAKQGVEVRFADFDQRESLIKAFSGAKRALMISTGAVYPRGIRAAHQKAAIEAMAETPSVEHILMIAAGSPTPDPCFWEGDHYQTELVAKATGKPWTILRDHEYFDFHAQYDWPHWLAAGEWYTASGLGRAAFVARADCARAAAAALDSDSTASKCYEISDGEVYSAADIVQVLCEETGASVKIHQVTTEELKQHLVSWGTPPVLASALAFFQESTKAGNKDCSSNAFRELTGQEPVKLRQFVKENKAAILEAMARPIPLPDNMLD